MRSEKIHDAYRSVLPDAQTRDRLIAQILSQKENTRPKRHSFRSAILIAACVALLAGLAAGGYAAYLKWTLPKPETYTPTENGYLAIHAETEYTREELDQTQISEPLTDEYFIQTAIEILGRLGKTDVDTGKITVARQENMHWSREEAEVQFNEGDNRASVTFNAETGALVEMIDMDGVGNPPPEALNTNDAENLARYYYGLLPVPQGYELKSVEEYDSDFWSYDFCRRINEDLLNTFEMVRVCVNPVSGTLCMLVVFDVPLLDDHAPGDIPLTQAEAEKIALEQNENLSTYTLKSAEVETVLPNWFFSDYEPVLNSRASNVCRLGWVLVYEKTGESFSDEVWMYIDYYTGEVLGGDITG